MNINKEYSCTYIKNILGNVPECSLTFLEIPGRAFTLLYVRLCFLTFLDIFICYANKFKLIFAAIVNH